MVLDRRLVPETKNKGVPENCRRLPKTLGNTRSFQGLTGILRADGDIDGDRLELGFLEP